MLTMNEMGGQIFEVSFNDFRPYDSVSLGYKVTADALTFNLVDKMPSLSSYIL